jgi:hypothetical protein
LAPSEKGVLYTDGAKVTLPGTWNVSSSWDGRHIIAWTDREATVATAAGDIAWTVPGVWADGGTLASGGGAFVAAIRRTDPPVVLRAVRDIAPGLANRLWGPGGDTTLAVCTAPGRVAASTPVGADGFQVHLIDGRDRAMLVGRAISADGHTVVAQCIVAGTGKYEIWVLRW